MYIIAYKQTRNKIYKSAKINKSKNKQKTKSKLNKRVNRNMQVEICKKRQNMKISINGKHDTRTFSGEEVDI